MSGTPPQYVHGRSDRESVRLHDQASGLGFLLQGTRYPPGSTVLEAGCGVGAQTLLLAANSPHAQFVSVDLSAESLARAEQRVLAEGLANVAFGPTDICNLPFPDRSFAHVFVCFTLEHIPNPLLALDNLKRILRAGGTITVIEGDHGTAVFHPDTQGAHHVIDCLVDLQRQAGGNAHIGRELEHLAHRCRVCGRYHLPRQTYASASIPRSSGAVKGIFIAMIEGVREPAIRAGLSDPESWDRGIRDLYRTTEPGGVFCYTFFKGVGRKDTDPE